MKLSGHNSISYADAVKHIASAYNTYMHWVRQEQEAFAQQVKRYAESAARTTLETAPEIQQIFWSQYTPIWNDGADCRFTVHEPSFVLHSDDRPYADYDGSTLEQYSPQDAKRIQSAFDEFVCVFDVIPAELMQLAYGDNTIVRIAADSIKTEAYDAY